MRKFVSLLLAVLLLVAMATAEAETVRITEDAQAFDLIVELPEGATIQTEEYNGVPYSFLSFADETKPTIYISVAPTEEYDEASLAQLSPEDLEQLFQIVSADMDQPSYEVKTTIQGYPYMLVTNDSDHDSASLVTVHDHYFIQLSLWLKGFTVLSETDIRMAESTLNTLQVIPK